MQVSVTDISIYNDCPRKFYYTATGKRGLTREAGMNSDALEFGSLFHLAMAIYYSGSTGYSWITVGKLLDTIKPEYRKAEWAEDFQAILSHYAKYYNRNDFNDVIGVEIPFKLKLPKYGSIMGRVDGVVEEDGQLWVLEHKTSKSTSNVYDVADFNLQSLAYVIAMEYTMQKPVAGIIYNAIAKTPPALVFNKDKTVSASRTRGTHTWLAKELEKQGYGILLANSLAKDDMFFLRFKKTFNDKQKDMFLTYLQRIYRRIQADTYFDYHWNPLLCSYCGVKQVCMMMNNGTSEQTIERHIANEYVQRTDKKPQYFKKGACLIYNNNTYYLWHETNQKLTKYIENDLDTAKEAYDGAGI